MIDLGKLNDKRKLAGLTWDDLAKGLPIAGNSLRVAFKRGRVDKIYLDHVLSLLNAQNIQNEPVDYKMDAEGFIVNDPLEIFNTKAGSNYEELANGKYLLTVPLIPVRAQATYISEFTDAEYLSELKKVSFIVDRVGKGKYQAFEVQNDSMNDGTINSIPDGAIVLGRELGKQHWTSKLNTNGYPYWIIVHKNTVLCKEITDHNIENGTITCHSLNASPEYPDFDLELNDIRQLFNIIKKQI